MPTEPLLVVHALYSFGDGRKNGTSAAIFFAGGCLGGSLGTGTFTQVNSITEAMQNTFQFPPAVCLYLSYFGGIVIFSGIQSIAFRVSTQEIYCPL